jgi:hypothetical protein
LSFSNPTTFVARQRRVHLTGKHGIHRGRRALIRDVVDVDVGQTLQHLDRETRAGGRPGARERYLARFCSRRVEQVLERAVGRQSVDDKNLRRSGQVADWSEAGEWIVIQFAEMRVYHEFRRADQQRVAIGLGA